MYLRMDLQCTTGST